MELIMQMKKRSLLHEGTFLHLHEDTFFKGSTL